jgi:hypothetical protein
MPKCPQGWQRCPTDADAVYIWLSLSILLPTCVPHLTGWIAPTCGASGYAVVGAVRAVLAASDRERSRSLHLWIVCLLCGWPSDRSRSKRLKRVRCLTYSIRKERSGPPRQASGCQRRNLLG